MLLSYIILSLLVLQIHSYGSFRNVIPNGRLVDNPCSTSGAAWSGVGHRSAGGGGELNSFGTDFELAGRTWTQSLCNKDSDGDGITNGVELGDPNCVWTVGDQPETNVLSHPGICEPIGTATCEHQLLQC